ncbi:STAS domain-containing protein [Kitasatospora sp. NPDC057500]|uniref:STAS domain-containing protein n=1 Tax=Kitasatospora sp. NPDC057500 TaxID=3346151 RepID=UPI0036C263D9
MDAEGRPAASPWLKCETLTAGAALVCRFTGDLSMDSEAEAAGALHSALDRRPAVLAVDLARVGLFTSSGLNLLLAARRRALAAGVRLVLIAPCPMARRVLELTDTAALFPVCATAEEAGLLRGSPSGPAPGPGRSR